MEMTSGAMTFWILTLSFLAVGIHLILYSRRRKKMFESFAKKHQLNARPEREKGVQETLDTCLSSEDASLLRTFGQLSSLVEGESIWLFRAVELIDIKPRVRSNITHFPRIAALFEVSTEFEEFFLLDQNMRVTNMIPETPQPNPGVVEVVKHAVSKHEGRHTFSVTLKSGHGLVYFEPLVTGGEKTSDIETLYCIAKTLRKELSKSVKRNTSI